MVLNIPLARCVSILALWLTGETINVMTLGGQALAIGILVDEAAVKVKNIHAWMARTESVPLAVRLGNLQTAVPRLLATVCILAVFSSKFFMQVAHWSVDTPQGWHARRAAACIRPADRCGRRTTGSRWSQRRRACRPSRSSAAARLRPRDDHAGERGPQAAGDVLHGRGGRHETAAAPRLGLDMISAIAVTIRLALAAISMAATGAATAILTAGRFVSTSIIVADTGTMPRNIARAPCRSTSRPASGALTSVSRPRR